MNNVLESKTIKGIKMSEYRRAKMCKNKTSFTSKGAALRVTEKYGQRVYECPVCFCFHCTSKSDWKEEFVPIEKYQNLNREYEKTLKILRGMSKVKQRLDEMRQLNFKLLKCIKRWKIQKDENSYI